MTTRFSQDAVRDLSNPHPEEELTDTWNPRPSSGNAMRVVVVEEQEVIRRGLLALMSSIPGVSASAVACVPARDEQMSADFDVTLISTSALVSAERAGCGVEHLRPVIVIVPAAEPHLFEIATLSPGFTIDEPAERLGESLMLPERHEPLRSRLEHQLTPVTNPRTATADR